MKAAFGVEAIGLHASQRITAKRAGLLRAATPWVAELVGLSARYGFERRFLRYKSDWAQSNGAGSRGVWLWWTLESGHFYEARYRTSWSLSSGQHRFLTVTDDGDVQDVTEADVLAHLQLPRPHRTAPTRRRVVRRVVH